MKEFKRTLATVMALTMMTSMFAACGAKEEEAPAADSKPAASDSAEKKEEPKAEEKKEDKKDIVLSIAGTSGATDTQSMAHVEYAKRLNELGGWAAEAKIGGVMGETDDVTEQALQGVPVINSSDPGRMAAYVNDYGLLAMPYLFDDPASLDAVMETELYKGWEEDFRAQGMEMITSNCFSGIRSLIGPDIYKTPADLEGVQLRTIGTPAYLGTIEAMGATAVPLAWGDTYQGIEQGTVDGTEAQIPGIYSMKFYEVCDSISLSEHFMLIGSIFCGSAWFDTLSAEDQANLIEIGRATYHDNQALVVELSDQYIEEMRNDYGVTIEEIDKTAFIEASLPVYDELGYADLRTELYAQMGM